MPVQISADRRSAKRLSGLLDFCQREDFVVVYFSMDKSNRFDLLSVISEVSEGNERSEANTPLSFVLTSTSFRRYVRKQEDYRAQRQCDNSQPGDPLQLEHEAPKHPGCACACTLL